MGWFFLILFILTFGTLKMNTNMDMGAALGLSIFIGSVIVLILWAVWEWIKDGLISVTLPESAPPARKK